ncbi:DUF6185 family protein [Streptomyces sp. NBC_00557]|uniref:DUF6185 family protein n=1 Tax=Streptomyces sp. NBC_00557 TaxID=2975776 RepID=UPI002E7FDF54|nr:DUF6185 family protein [Streptomyces sp. NBC_00557]WUC34893.1 DUF6185 family protein [Streptomyces sp. NBC_00557]
MAMIRWWWRLLSLIVLVVCGCGCGTAQAQQRSTGAGCPSDGLRDSTVHATIRLDEHKRTYPLVTSDMTVSVPRKWRLARHLTFSERSPQYRQAMRCLLRGDRPPGDQNEWHPYDPVVTAKGDHVTVRYVAYTWISQEMHSVHVGPWEIMPQGKTWTIYLRPPTFQTIRWSEIDADLGGLRFNDLSEQAWSSSEDDLVWKNQVPGKVAVAVDLPWQRTLAEELGRSALSTAGVASWWVGASIVIVLAALRTRRADAVAGRGTVPEAPGAQQVRARVAAGTGDLSPVQTMLQWAVLSAAIALTLLLLASQSHLSPRSHALLFIPAGVALILVARPWSRGVSPPARGAVPDAPTRSEIQRRQARAVIGTVCAVAAAGLFVVLVHDAFGLPEGLKPKTATAVGRTGLVVLGLATVWLWMAAMAAWAWRFALEGGFVRGRWAAQWDRAPGRCVAAVGALLAVLAGVLLGYALWVGKRTWVRVHWLAEPRDPTPYHRYIDGLLEGFFFTDLVWLVAYSWVLTGVALLALLHFRNRPARADGGTRAEPFALGPSNPDLLLITSMFAFFVGLRAARFAGANAFYGIWLLLNILSLYAVLAVGRRWSVLSMLGDCFRVQRLGTEEHRCELLEKAHAYRGVNHRMYLLDQGRADDVTCQELEAELHGLREWLVEGCEGIEPPERISVLDVALAWGPEGHWWHNALRAARLAFWFGIPATGLLLYFEARDPFASTQILYGLTGIPDVVAELFLYQLAWAGAGFTFGALWRLLPGRRSQVRAWILTAAYSVPVLLATLLRRITDTDPGQLTLYSVLLLSVLTLTSLWMDMATFRAERQYWPSPLALLVSIYQLRGLSGQIAWLLVQLGAAITIWYHLTR